MQESKHSWEESQNYLAFMASSISISNEEIRRIVNELLKKHEKGKTWTKEELELMKEIVIKRKQQIHIWELDSAIT
ncbi:MAG: hypothetical protein ACXAEU_23255 [Candidatus Hodarchaeales archaeon]|jgi:hypothetical protein